ncbi:hypothetical protein EON71_00330 [bacterium]|nr:MAG: hypothetical protein EON71_00330 [bacterium]
MFLVISSNKNKRKHNRIYEKPQTCEVNVKEYFCTATNDEISTNMSCKRRKKDSEHEHTYIKKRKAREDDLNFSFNIMEYVDMCQLDTTINYFKINLNPLSNLKNLDIDTVKYTHTEDQKFINDCILSYMSDSIIDNKYWEKILYVLKWLDNGCILSNIKQIFVQDKKRSLKKVLFTTFVSPILENEKLCNSCTTDECISPYHLFCKKKNTI